ncbi:MAG: Rieske 2Fe-2S domain-containing protein [Proteobacteria bacterium]|nr:Rieske 2Fe-2S domain-containing protein [Pseudomonadota bacterium]
MAEFIKVASLDEVQPGTGTTVSAGDVDIALFNVGGTVYAINDRCAHAGQSLGFGELTGKVVRCRAHGWKYDVTTGFANGIQGFGVACYPVKVVDNDILVAVGAGQ